MNASALMEDTLVSEAVLLSYVYTGIREMVYSMFHD